MAVKSGMCGLKLDNAK